MKEYEKPQMEIIELSGADVNTGCEGDIIIISEGAGGDGGEPD